MALLQYECIKKELSSLIIFLLKILNKIRIFSFLSVGEEEKVFK